MLRAVLAIIAGWLTLDFLHALWIRWRVRRWEASQTWQPDGVRAGSAAWSCGAGSTAVLLVHGFNDGPTCYRFMAPELARAGLACRAMRLPGFCERVEAHARATAGDWTAAVLGEAMQLRERHDRVLIIGHSLGGTAALAAVRAEPSVADGLVLLAPALGIARARSLGIPPGLLHRLSRFLLLSTRVTMSPFPHDAMDPAARQDPWKLPFVPRPTVDELLRLIASVRSAGPSITLPLLLILPGRDRVVDTRATRRFFETVASAHKRSVVMARSGHTLPIDREWPAICRAIVDMATDPVAPSGRGPPAAGP